VPQSGQRFQDGGSYDRLAVILGRALHAPWNEGTRVISRNFAHAAGLRRRVRILSLTQEAFRSGLSETLDGVPPVEHVYTRGGYGMQGVYFGLPLVMRRLAASVAVREVDVAHLFNLPLSLAPWLQRYGVRVVVHVMVSPLRPSKRVLARLSMRLFAPWIDAYAVTSETLVPQLEAWGVPPSRLLVLPAAVDSSKFCIGDRRAARIRLGLSPDVGLVVYLGRLSPRRFPGAMVREALRQASADGTRPLRFVALAPGQTFDGSENSAQYVLECARAAEQDLQGIPGVGVDVTLHNLQDVDKIAWLQAADAVLLPFLAPEAVEPPMTLLEAMACGALIITSPAANRSGLIVSGSTGLAYDSPDQLAGCLSDVLANPQRSKLMGQQARQAVLERHSFDAVSNVAADLWRHLEHARTPSRRL
jgi:glycosyltransferase involved in cell wall biosynthesis